jgi:hypothetical protein
MDTHTALTSHGIHCSHIQKLSLSGEARRTPRKRKKKGSKERKRKIFKAGRKGDRVTERRSLRKE